MASNPVQLTFKVSPIPEDFVGTLNDFAQYFASRLSAETGYNVSLFVSGSTAPTSNVGPWLKDGNQWWVWSDGSAAYVPITVPSESLGYIAQVSPGPDQNIYTFWIELDGTGKAQSIQYYSGGAWKDIYQDKFAQYSTTAQMNSAIAAAVSSISVVAGQGVFRAKPAADQDVVFASSGTMSGTIALGTVEFDPDGAFASSKFTCPATGYYQFNAAIQIEVGSGSPSSLDAQTGFSVNGSSRGGIALYSNDDNTGNRVYTGATLFYLGTGDYVELGYTITVDAACTIRIDAGFTNISGYRVK